MEDRFQTHGLEGLASCPQGPPPDHAEEITQKILALSQQNPALGYDFLSAQLALEGIAITVQNILSRSGLGGRYECLLALEKQAVQEGK